MRRLQVFPTSLWALMAKPVAHWRRMLSTLAEYEPNEIQQSFATADRRIRNRGLSYRVAGEKDERVWPISRMPLLLTEEEWRGIADGVAQRAELLEEVLADVYGEGRLVAEGALPPPRLQVRKTISPRCAASDRRADDGFVSTQ